jgi:uncharacterized protein (TIGR02996 family)
MLVAPWFEAHFPEPKGTPATGVLRAGWRRGSDLRAPIDFVDVAPLRVGTDAAGDRFAFEVLGYKRADGIHVQVVAHRARRGEPALHDVKWFTVSRALGAAPIAPPTEDPGEPIAFLQQLGEPPLPPLFADPFVAARAKMAAQAEALATALLAELGEPEEPPASEAVDPEHEARRIQQQAEHDRGNAPEPELEALERRVHIPGWWRDHDDAARLRYADALLAAGDARGEFLRVQCHPHEGRLGRADELFSLHHAQWLRECGLAAPWWTLKPGCRAIADERLQARFTRGFLSELRIDERLCSAVGPLVEHAMLRDLAVLGVVPAELPALLPLLTPQRLQLTFAPGRPVPPRALEEFATGLSFLMLGSFEVIAPNEPTADDVAKVFLHHGRDAERLDELSLRLPLTTRTFTTLLTTEWVARLRSLTLGGECPPELLVPLLQHLPRLEHLELQVSTLPDPARTALLTHRTLRRLRLTISEVLPAFAALRAKFGADALRTPPVR